MTGETLDEELKRLHGDIASAGRLSALHEQAAETFGENADAARFHLTHAWVFALVDGREARVTALEARLRALGGL